ncbi:MAG TPA: HAMP domain-containing sensor histidine kinase [Polyangiaceae bacterium]|nr:HAMP domain-containing sensor histidine kinase [Polyangiaceae bacterium]
MSDALGMDGDLAAVSSRLPEPERISSVPPAGGASGVNLAAELARVRAESDAKTEFLSMMSHELRTPLNSMLGFAQLLERDKKEPLSSRHRERVENILKGGEHLVRLVEDIVDLSRIEARGLSVEQEAVNVDDVLDEVLVTLADAARRRGVRFERACRVNDPLFVLVDRTRFVQVLLNFTSNAVKYNRDRGLVLFSMCTPGPRTVRVTVTDTGIGIPLANQASIFRPFQRAGREDSEIPGTGLGLFVTRRLVELMGGTVGFRSRPSEGSDFWVEVPRQVEPPGTDTRRIQAPAVQTKDA